MPSLQRVLIANRGEIALRIIRTCRKMGLDSVAVFSDADAQSPHVKMADIAVNIGPAPASESYLCADRIIDAAKRTGAHAIHPGYGFLAENAAFAEAVAEAGLIFIGPTSHAIASMGSKTRAKALVAAQGVPTLPGYSGEDQSDARLLAEALKLPFPVLIKASAGGGGKGMRAVHAPEALEQAIQAARREAVSSFGDGTLMVERYIESPRHIEFQVLGDHHGNLVHLFERECSIQRRHQKIIEEAPSPMMTDELRAEMGAAAVAAARSVGYTNAGTVEFIVAPDGAFYFLEVNTRLQVEHPVTECITGLDLVREQIRVARGEALGYGQDDLSIDGHAIECRLYAEAPGQGFLPQTGTLFAWETPDDLLRVDSGVETGSSISVHYDPMIAKVISHGATRKEATDRMHKGLRELTCAGLSHNKAFLIRVLAHEAWESGDLDTHFIETHFADYKEDTDVPEALLWGATLASHEARLEQRSSSIPSGFRNNRALAQSIVFSVGEQTFDVRYHHRGAKRFDITINGGETKALEVLSASGGCLVLLAGGVRHTLNIAHQGAAWHVSGLDAECTFEQLPRFPSVEQDAVPGACTAPMPGKVVKVMVSAGEEVSRGAALMILEAMKMEHVVTAPEDGVVSALNVEAGEQVEVDQLLAVVTASDEG